MAEAAQEAGLTPPGMLGLLPSHGGGGLPLCRPELQEEAAKSTFYVETLATPGKVSLGLI